MRSPTASLPRPITPHFKLGDYDGGVEAGVDQMISVVNGEPLPEPDRKWEQHGGLGNLLPLLLVVVFVGSGVLRAHIRPAVRIGRHRRSGRRHRLALEPCAPHRRGRRRGRVPVRDAAGSARARVVGAAAAGAGAWAVWTAVLGGFGGGFGGGGGGGGFSGGGGGLQGGGASGSW